MNHGTGPKPHQFPGYRWMRVLWSVTLVAVLLLLPLSYSSFDQGSHLPLNQLAQALDRENSRINEEILRLRNHLHQNYDLVNTYTNSAQQIFAELVRIASADQNATTAQRRLIELLTMLFQEKLDAIEQFKSHHALIQNISLHLPRAIEIVKQRDPDDLELQQLTAQLHVNLLNTQLFWKKTDEVAANNILQRINDKLLLLDRQADEVGNRLDQYARLIFSTRPQMDHNIQIILDSHIPEQIQQLNRLLKKAFIRKSNERGLFQGLLILLIGLVTLYAVHTFMQLQNKSSDLQQALNDIENRQHALDEHAIVSMTDVTGVITYVNQKFVDISQYSRQELMGAKHNIIKSDEHSNQFFRNMWRTIANGRSWHGEIKNRARDGGHYWTAASIVPFLNDQGKPYQYIGIRTDITRQKQMEEELQEGRQFLQSITDNMGEGVYAVDMQGNCTFMNREAEALLGWVWGELVGENTEALIGLELPNGSHQRAIFRSDDTFLTRKDGQRFPAAVTRVPLIEAGNHVGAVTVFQDITLRKEKEQQLRTALQDAEQSARAKSEFLANVSHEIRTPMNGIIGMTDLLLETDRQPENREKLEIIQSSAYTLLTLINDILDFSKIEAGKLKIDPVVCHLPQEIEDTLRSLKQQSQAKGLALAMDLDTKLPEWVIIDNIRLRQVLINLIGNGIKFTPSGEVRLSVRPMEPQNGEPAMLEFAVRDTGIGISQQAQQHIFDSFSQADSSITREYGGTGLGLSISYNLIQLMHGRLTLQSAPGQGSTFRFALPLERPDEAAVQASREKQPNDSELRENLRKLRILLAEDNRINQKLATTILERQKHRVTLAENGQIALDMYRSETFDLILMDMQMPVMDGLRATEEIRALENRLNKKRIPIIAVTANAMQSDRDRCLAAGMDGYVSKPYRPKELFDTIAELT